MSIEYISRALPASGDDFAERKQLETLTGWTHVDGTGGASIDTGASSVSSGVLTLTTPSSLTGATQGGYREASFYEIDPASFFDNWVDGDFDIRVWLRDLSIPSDTAVMAAGVYSGTTASNRLGIVGYVGDTVCSYAGLFATSTSQSHTGLSDARFELGMGGPRAVISTFLKRTDSAPEYVGTFSSFGDNGFDSDTARLVIGILGRGNLASAEVLTARVFFDLIPKPELPS